MKITHLAAKAALTLAFCAASLTAANAGTVTINLKANSKDFKVTFSSSGSVAPFYDKGTLTWNDTPDANGYYTGTWSYKWSLNTTLYGIAITPTNGNYLYSCAGADGTFSGAPSNKDNTLIIKNQWSKNTTWNVTLDLYPAVTYTYNTQVALNFDMPMTDVAVTWAHNGTTETISGSTATYATSWSETKVHDYLLSSDYSHKNFDNTLTITPLNGKFLDWQIAKANGALQTYGTDLTQPTNVITWNTANVDLNGATVSATSRDAVLPTFSIDPIQFNHAPGQTVTMDYRLHDLADLNDVESFHIWVVDLNSSLLAAPSRAGAITDGHTIVGEAIHTDLSQEFGSVALDKITNLSENPVLKLGVCAEAVLKNQQTAPSQSYVDGIGQGNTGGSEYVIDTTSGTTTGLDDILYGQNDSAPCYYNLQGQRIENAANGIFIRVINGKASKVIL